MIQRHARAAFLFSFILSLPACAVDHSSDAALSPPLPLHWWQMRPPQSINITTTSPHKVDRALRVDMNMRITLDIHDATLPQAIQAVWHATRVKLWISPALHQLALRPITYTASEIPLHQALDQIIRAAQPTDAAHTLIYQLRDHEILITTTDQALHPNPANVLQTRIYDCHWIAWVGFPPGGRTMYESHDNLPWDLMDELKQTLYAIDPSAWLGAGGLGTIDHFNGTLIIRQTPRMHHHINAMLNAIYKMRLTEIQSTF